MQNVEAFEPRMAVTRDQRIGIERGRFRAFVHDVVAHREHVFVVDRDGAAEFQALAVVVDESDRTADTERAGALLLPEGVAVRQRHGVPAAATQPNSA